MHMIDRVNEFIYGLRNQQTKRTSLDIQLIWTRAAVALCITMHTFVFNNTVSSTTLAIPFWQPSDDILINYYTGTSPPYTDPLTRSCSGNRSPISISNVLRSSTVELLFLLDTRAVHSHRPAGSVMLVALRYQTTTNTGDNEPFVWHILWVVVEISIILQRTERYW